MKNVLFFSSCFAAITTLVYGLELGIIVFVIARISWGICYSGLNITTLNYSAEVDSQSGLAFGISRSIKSLGAFFALWVGPLLINAFGFNQGMFSLAALSLVGILLALSLPESHVKSAKARTSQTFSLKPLHLLIFFLSFSVDGVLVVVLSRLLTEESVTLAELLVIVGLFLLFKRLTMVVFSLIGGFVTILLPAHKLFKVSIVACLLSLLLILNGITKIGIILAFTFNTIAVTLSPAIAIAKNRNNNLQAFSSVATWWDLGAAMGTFSGILLFEKIGRMPLFAFIIIITMIFFIQFTNTKENNYATTL